MKIAGKVRNNGVFNWRGDRALRLANLEWKTHVEGKLTEPVFVYYGEECTGSTLPAHTYGSTLTTAGTGGDPLTARKCPISDADAMLFTGGKYLECTTTSFADVGPGESLIIDGIIKTPAELTSGWKRVLSKENGVNGQGYQIPLEYSSGKHILHGYVRDADTTTGCSSSFSIDSDAWLYFTFAYCYNTGLQVCVNRQAGTVVPVTGDTSSLSNSHKFILGADDGGGSKPDIAIGCLAMWKGAGLISSADISEWHNRRFDMLFGFDPDRTHMSFSRSTSIFVKKTEDDGNAYWHQLSPYFPAIETAQRPDGVLRTGLRSQRGFIYKQSYSEDMASWNQESQERFTWTEGSASPIYGVNWTGMQCANNSNTKYISQYTNAENVGSYYFIGAFYKKGTVDWAYLGLHSFGASVLYVRQWFNVNTGAIGTAGGQLPAYAGMFQANDGWYCWMADVTTEAGQLNGYLAPADTDGNWYTGGNGSDVQTYVTGCNIVEGIHFPPMYKRMADTAITTNQDWLYASGLTMPDQGRVSASFIIPTYAKYLASAGRICRVVNDSSWNDFIEFISVGSDEKFAVQLTKDGAQQAYLYTFRDEIDGNEHSVTVRYKTNNAVLHRDGLLCNRKDTSITVPDGMNRLMLGTGFQNANADSVLITEAKIQED